MKIKKMNVNSNQGVSVDSRNMFDIIMLRIVQIIKSQFAEQVKIKTSAMTDPRTIRSVQRYRKQQKAVHTKLIEKYSSQFNFFLAKPISDIVYNDTKSSITNQAKDIIIFADDTEYLNRVYHYHNSFGKQEIYDRIRLIGGFYHDNMTMPEYPLMIITNTAKIFKTRERRLRKMIASDGSSDQTENQDQIQATFSSQGFLKSISSMPDSSQQIDSMFKSVSHKLQYQQDMHNVYQATGHIYQASNLHFNRLKEEQIIAYLICDFKDIDFQKTLDDYQRMIQARQNYVPLKSLAAQKPVFQSIIINEKGNSVPAQARDRFVADQRKESRTNRIKTEQNYMMNGQQMWDHERGVKLSSRELLYQDYRRKRKYIKSSEMNNFNRAQDLVERNMKRQKIRDKAAQLLTRVKNQDYVHGKIDILKY